MRRRYQAFGGGGDIHSRNRRLGKHKRGWEDNIYINLEERSWNCEGWINLTQDWNKRPAVVNRAMKLRKCWEFIY